MRNTVDSIATEAIKANNPEGVRFCPVCSYSGKFEPFGIEHPRPDARCPKCGSIERARLYYLFLISTDYLKMKSCRVLHAVPEQCIKYKINHLPNIEYHSHGLGELKKTSYEDNSVDVILANYVLDRVDDDLVVLDEMNRILSGDGIAMLSVHMKNDGTSDVDSMPRRYGTDYIERIAGHGFDVETILAKDLCGTTISYMYGIDPKDIIILAKKKNNSRMKDAE
jgi:SAM-dependent methyltransferase